MFRRRRHPPPDPGDVRVERGTEPIAIFTPDEVLEGWTHPQDGRLTESLNAGVPLPVELGSEGGIPEWHEFSPGDLIAVVPAPLSPSRRLDHGRRRSVTIRAARYEIHGMARVPPGAEEDYLLRPAQPWLPLTDATIRAGGEEWTARVVIANLDQAVELVRSG